MTNAPNIPPPNKPPPSLRFDWEEWLPYLEDANLTDDQKREFVETMWSVIVGFVDFGFDVKSGSESCGESLDLKAMLEAAVVSSDIQTDLTKGDAA